MNSLKQIYQSNIFKITSLNSISVLIKIAIGLVTSKLLAVFVGPSGMAYVGNLRNLMSSLESVSSLGFQTGILKYVTENDKNNLQLSKIISTVFFTILIVTLFLSCLFFVFATFFTNQIFENHTRFTIIIKSIGLIIPFYGISIFFLSVLNGLGKFKKVIFTNILGNILGLIVSCILIYNHQTFGALLSIVVAPTLLFIVTFYYLNNEINLLEIIKISNFDFKIIKDLSAYSLMTLVAAIFGPLVYLAIRNNIIANLGLNQAGFWETISRISTYYMLFVSTILSIYFLPRLIKANSNQETKIVFWDYFKYILSIFFFGIIIIYLLRFFIIKTLFTNDFLPVTNLFFWQLIGDFFKVASLILGFQFIAKKMTKAFLFSEILSLLILYLSSNYFLKIYGIEGVVIAQAFDNFLYFIVLAIYFRKSLV